MSVVDLLALREEALATDEGQQFAQGREFTFAGIEFRVPPQPLWPVKATGLLRDGDVEGALALIVGADVAAQLVDAGLLIDDVQRLTAQVSPNGGGHGPPSPRSSQRGS